MLSDLEGFCSESLKLPLCIRSGQPRSSNSGYKGMDSLKAKESVNDET